MALAMAVQSSAVKARLQQKAASRPHKMMRKLYPDGTGAIGDVPKRRALGEAEDEEATEVFCAAVRKAANVFGKSRRAQSTADEHLRYIVSIDKYLVRMGHGSFVTITSTSDDGVVLKVEPRRHAGTGAIRMIRPEMIVALLLDMASGSEDAPKGGHAEDIAANADHEMVGACGPRALQKRRAGKFGTGPYADECWSLQAYQKRVYAVRDFYKSFPCENPGWSDEVVGVLGALARLVGVKPLHVPQVCGKAAHAEDAVHHEHDELHDEHDELDEHDEHDEPLVMSSEMS